MKYTEHEKLSKVQEKSQACGSFLEWLQERYVLADYGHEHDKECYSKRSGMRTCDLTEEVLLPVRVSIPDLLGEYFGINQKKLENEKRHMLAQLRGEKV